MQSINRSEKRFRQCLQTLEMKERLTTQVIVSRLVGLLPKIGATAAHQERLLPSVCVFFLRSRLFHSTRLLRISSCPLINPQLISRLQLSRSTFQTSVLSKRQIVCRVSVSTNILLRQWRLKGREPKMFVDMKCVCASFSRDQIACSNPNDPKRD